jgi:hypothetical protein
MYWTPGTTSSSWAERAASQQVNINDLHEETHEWRLAIMRSSERGKRMATHDVLAALEQPENEPIDSTIGTVLRKRLDQEGWEEIILLQHLDKSSPRLAAWNDLFARARQSLANPTELAAKGSQLLANISCPRFNDALDDFVAEALAIIYLAECGHTQIRFPADGGPVTIDVESEHEGVSCFTEVKNLREPRSLSFVAFKRWNVNCATNTDKFTFQADLIDMDDPLRDLTVDQEAGVNALVDDLPNRKVPSEFDRMLSGERKLRVRLTEGAPAMLRHGSGPFLVGPVVESAKRSLLLKLMDPARKALSQLYRLEISENAKRLLFVRWKLPEQIAAFGEADGVRASVHEHAQRLLRVFFPNFALTITHTFEDPKDTPKATWT